MLGLLPHTDMQNNPSTNIVFSAAAELDVIARLPTASPHSFLGWAFGAYLKRDPVVRSVNIWQMQLAVDRLSPLEPSDTPLAMNFLTGHRFWYQTCLCAYSLVKQAGQHLRLVIYDDGTLTVRDQQRIQRLFPDVRIVLSEEITQRLDQVLPESRFPMLRSRRLAYPHLRKLIDIHAGATGWNLVLDSDMLFFHRPQKLLDWLQAPQQPCYMMDLQTAYGYSIALMTDLAGKPIPDKINVGLCGLSSDAIDWAQVESWCSTLMAKEGHHYFQEQALTAMLIAQATGAVAFPASEYLLMPNRAEVLRPRAMMHHYVDYSKPWYFRHAWRHIVKM
jgi:hypothetical protein